MSTTGTSVTVPFVHTSLSNVSILQLLSRDKLIGKNYLNWIHSLRINHRYNKKEYALDEDIPEDPYEDVTIKEFADYEKHHNQSNEVACLMLVSMVSKLQKSFEKYGSFGMNENLKEMFQKQA